MYQLKHGAIIEIDNFKQRIYIFHDFFNISVCESNEFLCTSGIQCVDSLAVCDGMPHCMDGTDEIACGKSRSLYYNDNKCIRSHL